METTKEPTTKLRVGGIERNSLVDGPGIRTVIYFSGCSHDCAGCHAKELQATNYGMSVSIDSLMETIEEDIDFVDGITLSGGDPVFQWDAVQEFLSVFKKKYPSKNVILYTGFLLKDLPLTEYNDVLYIIDGKFEKSSPTIKHYRGSDNQRMFENISGVWVNIDEE